MVAISSSGSTRDLLHVVKLARKQGVRVLALSNTPRSPLASLSDIQLVAAKPEGPLSAGALNAKAVSYTHLFLRNNPLYHCDHNQTVPPKQLNNQ